MMDLKMTERWSRMNTLGGELQAPLVSSVLCPSKGRTEQPDQTLGIFYLFPFCRAGFWNAKMLCCLSDRILTLRV